MNAISSTRGAALVVGVGPGLGAALCRGLARQNYTVFGVGRSLSNDSALAASLRAQAPGFRAFAADAADRVVMKALVAEIEAQAPLTALIYNAAGFRMGAFEDLHPAEFEQMWRVCCLGAMVTAHECLPRMAARGTGAALFTGATASIRGGANFAAFASAKFALRGLVQSLSRAYWPRGVHVAHTLIDGIIGANEGQLHPDEIAAAYLGVLQQPRSAWTQELDLRPNAEKF